MKPLKFYAALLITGLFVLGATSAFALLAQHDCSFCHDFHGAISNAGLLKATSSEVLCLSCHNVAINGTKASAVHNPRDLNSNQQGYITCRECHNPHDNIAGNVKLVGYKFDSQNNRRFSVPTIRVELPTSDPLNPVYKPVTFALMTSPNADYYRSDGKGACQICHPSNHLVGRDCTLCHEHNKDFSPQPPKGFPATGACTTCHTGTGTDAGGFYSFAAYNVGTGSPHTKIKATDASSAACTACHPSHGAAPSVVVANNATVGISYSANGEAGIALGGTATSGTTEAEICWNCHDQDGNGSLNDAGDISEWKGFAYNGYTVTGSKSWATANFDAPGSRIPTRATVSIHSANEIDTDATITKVRASSVAHNVDASGRTSNHASFSGTKTLEEVKYIRCSYCHDVHNTYGPNKGATWTFDGVSRVNAPTYLRGKWYENPYYARTAGGGTTAEIPPEAALHEGADYYTDNQNRYTGNDRWGTVTVPRLIANTTGSEKSGGYFIDQNSRWPTRAAGSATHMTVADTAGLCTMCHNLSTDSMDYYPSSSLWRTDIVGWKNGHGNSTLGGSGRSSTGNNIFNAALRPESASPGITNVSGYMGFQGQDDPHINQWAKDRRPLPWDTSQYSTQPFDGGGSPVQNSGWYNWARAGLQRQANSAQLRGGDYTTWYGGSTNSGIGGDGRDNIRAHNFTCSKCHTPHASGLPALLITNCLDYKVSDFGVNSSAGPTNLGPTASGTGQRNLVAIQAPNNCHRKSSTSTGWHKLAPQQ